MSSPDQGPSSSGAASGSADASSAPTSLPSKRPLSPGSSTEESRTPRTHTPAAGAGPSTAPTPEEDADEQVDDALDATAGAQPVTTEEWYELQFKWSGKSFDLRVSSSDLCVQLFCYRGKS